MKSFLRHSISYLDLISWVLVFVFFGGSALLFKGNLPLAMAGSLGVIIEMFFIAISIEIVIECLKNTKGIGTLTGFITNGPEAVCLLVGLAVGDIIFAASTPLGSNFMNPILLGIAGLLCYKLRALVLQNPLYTFVTIGATAMLAGSFFFMTQSTYPIWLIVAVLVTVPLFYFRPPEEQNEEKEEHSFSPSFWLFPSISCLTVAGYYLDPVVSFAAKYSMAPKGIIGFVVLATLTSWPEFKSCIALLKRRQILAAVLNITVSNITNIWLAAIGITTYLFV
ncbi:sodium:proton exchanger [Desulforhopalus sp. IMCC35007]|uniref:sodium:proton exchanger n=1 Tax=Desulforhopalus sp. IMCC35007 TaxID=2569543 RepID=UPI0010AEEA67|nr:sodium:proton exchanger [Desulforhopalus sp. IMCC35007]TKB09068.1 sodium:proton exchanger [Desulforhopalus sp. IMCC35007]